MNWKSISKSIIKGIMSLVAAGSLVISIMVFELPFWGFYFMFVGAGAIYALSEMK